MKFDYKIIEDIGESTLKYFIAFLEGWDDKRTPKILLSTTGGNGEMAAGIMDYCKTHDKKFHCYCIGRVESAGTIIMKAASRVFSYKNCTFMIHNPISGNGNWRNQWRHRKKLGLYVKILKRITPTIKLRNNPTYLTAREALDEGLVDEIL